MIYEWTLDQAGRQFSGMITDMISRVVKKYYLSDSTVVIWSVMIKILKRLTRQILSFEETEMEHVDSELEEWFCSLPSFLMLLLTPYLEKMLNINLAPSAFFFFFLSLFRQKPFLNSLCWFKLEVHVANVTNMP